MSNIYYDDIHPDQNVPIVCFPMIDPWQLYLTQLFCVLYPVSYISLIIIFHLITNNGVMYCEVLRHVRRTYIYIGMI